MLVSRAQRTTRSVRFFSAWKDLDFGATHTVKNQSAFLEDFNRYETDNALREGVSAFGGEWAHSHLSDFGALTGSAEFITGSFLANDNPPTLHTHSRTGARIDEVAFHPAYHRIMRAGYEAGIAALPYGPASLQGGGGNVVRAALAHMAYATESGTMCPLSMTRACLPVLKQSEEAMREWIRGVEGGAYDERNLPARHKRGLTLGMSMTEKQGGSDVRSNETTAVEIEPGVFALTGHKWFTSAPMSDAFLTLAYTDTADGRGLSCFLVPRWLPDDTRNEGLRFMRLKSKLGDRSNASSEVEYHNAVGWLIGAPGRGVRTILDMVHNTRLDCITGSAALMRHGVATACHHAEQRSAFGATLARQPAMTGVLADLHLEAEASTWLALRIAHAFDNAEAGDAAEAAFARIAVAIGKFYVCKRAPGHVAEALECLGGNGYVEDSGMPRAFRQSPLNGVWEGSGNVIALDVLRALTRDRDCLPALEAELRAAAGWDPVYDASVTSVLASLRALDSNAGAQADARALVERTAVLLQAGLLHRYSPPSVADAFCSARIKDPARFYGSLPSRLPVEAVVERARPSVLAKGM